MKKHCLLFFFVMLGSLAYAQMQLNASGNVGVGTTPSTTHKLNLLGNSQLNGVSTMNGYLRLNGESSQSGATFHLTANNSYPGLILSAGSSFSCSQMLTVYGNAFAYGTWSGSDSLLKKNITTLDDDLMLSKVMNLSGSSYEFKSLSELTGMSRFESMSDRDQKLRLPEGLQYGFIAQDLEKEFPDLVKTEVGTSLKAINYDGMIPILLECIKAQQVRIAKLEERFNSTESTTPDKTSKQQSNSQSLATVTDQNKLFQNSPNPFNASTEIRYYLEESVQQGMIYLFNMQGTLLRTVKLSDRGYGEITVNASEFKPGMYLYSLVTDGKEVDTKRMILTE